MTKWQKIASILPFLFSIFGIIFNAINIFYLASDVTFTSLQVQILTASFVANFLLIIFSCLFYNLFLHEKAQNEESSKTLSFTKSSLNELELKNSDLNQELFELKNTLDETKTNLTTALTKNNGLVEINKELNQRNIELNKILEEKTNALEVSRKEIEALKLEEFEKIFNSSRKFSSSLITIYSKLYRLYTEEIIPPPKSGILREKYFETIDQKLINAFYEFKSLISETIDCSKSDIGIQILQFRKSKNTEEIEVHTSWVDGDNELSRSSDLNNVSKLSENPFLLHAFTSSKVNTNHLVKDEGRRYLYSNDINQVEGYNDNHTFDFNHNKLLFLPVWENEKNFHSGILIDIKSGDFDDNIANILTLFTDLIHKLLHVKNMEKDFIPVKTKKNKKV